MTLFSFIPKALLNKKSANESFVRLGFWRYEPRDVVNSASLCGYKQRLDSSNLNLERLMAEYEIHIWGQFCRLVNNPKQKAIMIQGRNRRTKIKINEELKTMPDRFFEQFCLFVKHILENKDQFMSQDEIIEYMKQDTLFMTTLMKVDATTHRRIKQFSWVSLFTNSKQLCNAG